MPTPKVYVGVPSINNPTWPMVTSLLYLKTPTGSYPFRKMGPCAVDIARNQIVDEFLLTDRDWLLQIDDDVKFLPESLLRMLSWGQPIVQALQYMRWTTVLPMIYQGKAPHDPSQYMMQVDETFRWVMAHQELMVDGPVILEPRPDDALAPIDFAGCGFMLCHRSVFETIERPWFVLRGLTYDERGKPSFADHTLKEGTGGEDTYFYQKAIAAGFTPFVDRSVQVGHLPGDNPLGGLSFAVWYQHLDPSGREEL